MLIKCYVEGAVAGVNGETVDANPYDYKTKSHDDWLAGHSNGVIAEKRRRGRGRLFAASGATGAPRLIEFAS
jgi:ribosome modulation factor